MVALCVGKKWMLNFSPKLFNELNGEGFLELVDLD